MAVTTSDWIAIIGILLASFFAILMLRKKTKKNKTEIIQKSGALSKGNQKQNINIHSSDD